MKEFDPQTGFNSIDYRGIITDYLKSVSLEPTDALLSTQTMELLACSCGLSSDEIRTELTEMSEAQSNIGPSTINAPEIVTALPQQVKAASSGVLATSSLPKGTPGFSPVLTPHNPFDPTYGHAAAGGGY